MKKPAVRRSSIFLCSNPMYYCGLAKGWLGEVLLHQKRSSKKTGQLSMSWASNIPKYQTGSFFNGLNKTILGYFGLPMLYMVPHEDWSRLMEGGDVWYGFQCVGKLGHKTPYLGGGNSNIFYFHPENWGKIPIFTLIFCRWVGSTTNQIYIFNFYIYLQYISSGFFPPPGVRLKVLGNTPTNKKTPWEINPCVLLGGFDVT